MHLIFGVAGGILLAVWVLNGCPYLRQIILGTLAIGALAIVAILACVYLPQISFSGAGRTIGVVGALSVMSAIRQGVQNKKAAAPKPAAPPMQYAKPTRLLLPYCPAPIPPEYRFPAGPRRMPMVRTSLG